LIAQLAGIFQLPPSHFRRFRIVSNALGPIVAS
jgi:hypothetical protein